MKINTIYIDDENDELKKYKRKFENDERTKDRFEIIDVNSQKKIEYLKNEIKKGNPELILVDFDLSIPDEGLLLGLSGAALSTALREEFPDIPIVLFTKLDLLAIQEINPRVLATLDETIYKTNVFKDDSTNIDILYIKVG